MALHSGGDVGLVHCRRLLDHNACGFHPKKKIGLQVKKDERDIPSRRNRGIESVHGTRLSLELPECQVRKHVVKGKVG